MFCPRCSQEQISDYIKFCSRCGFLLTDVAEALQNGGTVKRNVIQSAGDLKIAAIKSIVIMVLAAKFILLSFILGTPEPSVFVQFNLLVGILFFLFGMGLITYNFWIKPLRLQGKNENKVSDSEYLPNSFQKAQTTNNLLSEADVSQVVSYVAPQKSFTTKDLVGTPSITEDTTKSLGQNKADI